MTFSIQHAAAPVFAASLRDMSAWLDKIAGDRAGDLLNARLAPDMQPLTAQYQMASDTAKNALARLSGTDAPGMPDIESTVAELKDRCARTIAYVEGFDGTALADAADREVQLRFPNGMGYRWTGADYLTGFALPNFFFHVTTAYAILRANGVALGKPDFLAHLGAPNLGAAA